MVDSTQSRLRPLAAATLLVAGMTAATAAMLLRGPGYLAVGPLLGIVAWLYDRRRGVASLSSLAGALLGHAALLVLAPGTTLGPAFLLRAVITASLATLGAFALEYVTPRLAEKTLPALRVVLPWVAFGLIVVAAFSASIWTAAQPGASGRTTFDLLSGTPPVEAQLTDQAMYLLYIRRLQAGDAYYPAVADVLDHANRAWPEPVVDLSNPLSFRPPLLFEALASLPPAGSSIVITLMVCGTLSAAAAYVLARTYSRAPVALAAPALVLGYFTTYSLDLGPMNPEVWAGGLGLISVALLVRGLRAENRRRAALIGAAAAVATLATFVRELAIAYVILGVLAVLADRAARRASAVWPFAAGIAAIGAGFAAHANAAKAAAVGKAIYHGSRRFPWWNPDGRGLVSAVSAFATGIKVVVLAGWAACLAAAIGVWIAPRSLAEKIVLRGAVIGGLVALALVHPPGENANGLVPAYWSGVVAPTLLACVPLAFARLAPADDYSPVVETPMSSAASSSVH